jgi:hypothetical protein
MDAVQAQEWDKNKSIRASRGKTLAMNLMMMTAQPGANPLEKEPI